MQKITTSQILKQLAAAGYRMTTTRVALITVLNARNCQPITAMELLVLLKQRGIEVNKTTVYRELEFLKGQGLIQEINGLGSGARYELNHDHHHHLICTSCDRWLPLTVDESFMRGVKKTISKQKAVLTDHLLEFFGLCARCRARS